MYMYEDALAGPGMLVATGGTVVAGLTTGQWWGIAIGVVAIALGLVVISRYRFKPTIETEP